MSNPQIGMSKDRMLRLFHPDALDLLNITNSLTRLPHTYCCAPNRSA